MNDATDDEHTGDGDNDTVNIDVNDGPPSEGVDPYDLIGGYEGAVEGTGDDAGTYTTHDVIDLDSMGGSIETVVAEDTNNIGDQGAIGDVVDQIDGDELQGFLWVNADGELVFDAGGAGEDGGDDDNLAKLMQPSSGGGLVNGYTNDPAVDGVTVRFEAEIELVDAVDGLTLRSRAPRPDGGIRGSLGRRRLVGLGRRRLDDRLIPIGPEQSALRAPPATAGGVFAI